MMGDLERCGDSGRMCVCVLSVNRVEYGRGDNAADGIIYCHLHSRILTSLSNRYIKLIKLMYMVFQDNMKNIMMLSKTNMVNQYFFSEYNA